MAVYYNPSPYLLCIGFLDQLTFCNSSGGHDGGRGRPPCVAVNDRDGVLLDPDPNHASVYRPATFRQITALIQDEHGH